MTAIIDNITIRQFDDGWLVEWSATQDKKAYTNFERSFASFEDVSRFVEGELL